MQNDEQIHDEYEYNVQKCATIKQQAETLKAILLDMYEGRVPTIPEELYPKQPPPPKPRIRINPLPHTDYAQYVDSLPATLVEYLQEQEGRVEQQPVEQQQQVQKQRTSSVKVDIAPILSTIATTTAAMKQQQYQDLKPHEQFVMNQV